MVNRRLKTGRNGFLVTLVNGLRGIPGVALLGRATGIALQQDAGAGLQAKKNLLVEQVF